jgi:DNA/RNA-binding domain of Phe-tRNA-synthetase-like protein
LHIAIDPELVSVVTLGALALEDARVVNRERRLDGPMAATAEQMRSACEAGNTVALVRAMYKRIGIDPTKTRPSSEALLRRVRKSDPLPRINSMVDVCNWCSLEFQLPYGVYDADRLSGAVTLRVGREGEEYAGIRKDAVHVAGRLALFDSMGPFGNPTSDSARTMVTTDTTRALLVIYVPVDVAAAAVRLALDVTAERMTTYCGARIVDARIIEGSDLHERRTKNEELRTKT